jgi:hypothetical protein
VGGVSGRPTRKAWWSNPLRSPGRNGGRHPDLPDVASLRGLTEQRESWSVRSRPYGARSRTGGRTDDNGVSSGRMRRGTSSACAKRTHSSRRRSIGGVTNEDTSFTRSRDPCTSIVTETPIGRDLGVSRCRVRWEVARQLGYRGRANPRKWERTGTGVLAVGRMRGSPRVTARTAFAQLEVA